MFDTKPSFLTSIDEKLDGKCFGARGALARMISCASIHFFVLLVAIIIGGAIFAGYVTAGAAATSDFFRYLFGVSGLLALCIGAYALRSQLVLVLKVCLGVVCCQTVAWLLVWILDAHVATLLSEQIDEANATDDPVRPFYVRAVESALFGVFAWLVFMISTLCMASYVRYEAL